MTLWISYCSYIVAFVEISVLTKLLNCHDLKYKLRFSSVILLTEGTLFSGFVALKQIS